MRAFSQDCVAHVLAVGAIRRARQTSTGTDVLGAGVSGTGGCMHSQFGSVHASGVSGGWGLNVRDARPRVDVTSEVAEVGRRRLAQRSELSAETAEENVAGGLASSCSPQGGCGGAKRRRSRERMAAKSGAHEMPREGDCSMEGVSDCTRGGPSRGRGASGLGSSGKRGARASGVSSARGSDRNVRGPVAPRTAGKNQAPRSTRFGSPKRAWAS